MHGGMTSSTAARLRRVALQALVAGLVIAAAAAIVALLRGSIDETELRVILTSVALSVFGSLAAVAAATGDSRSAAIRRFGRAASALAVVSFLLFLPAVWTDRADEALWRAWGCASILAVAGTHTALVLRSRQPTDGNGIAWIASASVVLGAADALAALAPVSGVVDDVDEGLARLFAVGLVLLVLTTILPPLLRRVQRSSAEQAPADAGVGSQVAEIADRIGDLAAGSVADSHELRRELARLRRLARAIDTGHTPFGAGGAPK